MAEEDRAVSADTQAEALYAVSSSALAWLRGECVDIYSAAEQLDAVRERLPGRLADVFAETGDRFQGLERPIMLVHRPLSGPASAC